MFRLCLLLLGAGLCSSHGLPHNPAHLQLVPLGQQFEHFSPNSQLERQNIILLPTNPANSAGPAFYTHNGVVYLRDDQEEQQPGYLESIYNWLTGNQEMKPPPVAGEENPDVEQPQPAEEAQKPTPDENQPKPDKPSPDDQQPSPNEQPNPDNQQPNPEEEGPQPEGEGEEPDPVDEDIVEEQPISEEQKPSNGSQEINNEKEEETNNNEQQTAQSEQQSSTDDNKPGEEKNEKPGKILQIEPDAELIPESENPTQNIPKRPLFPVPGNPTVFPGKKVYVLNGPPSFISNNPQFGYSPLGTPLRPQLGFSGINGIPQRFLIFGQPHGYQNPIQPPNGQAVIYLKGQPDFRLQSNHVQKLQVPPGLTNEGRQIESDQNDNFNNQQNTLAKQNNNEGKADDKTQIQLTNSDKMEPETEINKPTPPQVFHQQVPFTSHFSHIGGQVTFNDGGFQLPFGPSYSQFEPPSPNMFEQLRPFTPYQQYPQNIPSLPNIFKYQNPQIPISQSHIEFQQLNPGSLQESLLALPQSPQFNHLPPESFYVPKIPSHQFNSFSNEQPITNEASFQNTPISDISSEHLSPSVEQQNEFIPTQFSNPTAELILSNMAEHSRALMSSQNLNLQTAQQQLSEKSARSFRNLQRRIDEMRLQQPFSAFQQHSPQAGAAALAFSRFLAEPVAPSPDATPEFTNKHVSRVVSEPPKPDNEDAVMITSKLEDLDDDTSEKKITEEESEKSDIEESGISHAQPEAVAIAGKGGAAQASPGATAFAGTKGLAIATPVATAIA